MENKTQNRSDEIFEALLKVAVNEVIRQDVEEMPSIEKLDKLHKPSPAFEKRIQKIIRRHTSIRKIRHLPKTFTRAAAVFGIFVALSTAVLMSVEASRVFIFNMIVGLQDDHAIIDFVDDNIAAHGVEVGRYTLGYLPHSFELVDHQLSYDFTISIFMSQDGSRIILQYHDAAAAVFAVDIEYTDHITVYVNNKEAHLFSAESEGGLNTLVWVSGNTAFKLISDIEADELLRIAENIFRN
jgi:hypothetical protein